MGGAGGAKHRHAVLDPPAATSAGAAIGYALAAILVLWLPVHMAFHALTAAHVRRTAVSFAVALQCEASLQHGLSDVHGSFKRALSRRGDGDTAAAEDIERSVQHGRRFGAPGLAAAAVAFFGTAAGATVAVRPLLRAPLVAALGGHGKGAEIGSLALRKKPRGAAWRLKRALQSELDWHRRAARHAWRAVRRMLTPRLNAEARAARAGPGHAFRLVRADEWLGDDATPRTAALFELSVSFGVGGRTAAAAFRASLRDAALLGELEDAFAERVAAAEAAQRDAPGAAALGVRAAGAVLLALLDDEPHARLDAKKAGVPSSPRAAPAGYDVDAEEPESRSTGLSPAVAERLAALLVLCLKDKDAASRRMSRVSVSPRSQYAMPVAKTDGVPRGELLIAPFTVTVTVPDSPLAAEQASEQEQAAAEERAGSPHLLESLAGADVSTDTLIPDDDRAQGDATGEAAPEHHVAEAEV